MMRSSVFGFQFHSGFSWMKMTPRSKFTSVHVRCWTSPLRIPVNKIVMNNRYSDGSHA